MQNLIGEKYSNNSKEVFIQNFLSSSQDTYSPYDKDNDKYKY